ncbi:MAG: purine-nucleoside phosphorylase [Bacteroidales bacterium]|nr:purine-nucleoside phosphorylase [Bacteroidales bacterium]
MSLLQTIYTAADAVRGRIGDRQPQVGIVLGSGLGKLADQIEDPVAVPYEEIPGFPVSTAIGHKNRFIVGTLSGKCVIAMQGRIHYYDGYPMSLVTLPIRVMKVLGIQYLLVSNAAGGTNLDFHVGDLMVITDHINDLPNPLIGPNLDEFGPRFPDMTRPYDPKLIALADEIAAEKGIPLRKGVYYALTGPCYETPAEYACFRRYGADAVGMSTVPEVIVARHSNIPCFGISVITDVAHATDDEEYVTDGNAIIAAADAAADRMTILFKTLLERI